MRWLAAVLAACIVTAAGAETVATSPLPQVRPGTQDASPQRGRIILVPIYYNADIRPRPRPGTAVPERVVAPRVGLGLASAPLPRPRPAVSQAAPARSAGQAATRVSGEIGAICGAGDIIGRPLEPVRGRVRGCGVADPVRVSQVAGVRLSRSAVMDCGTARALRQWVESGVKPAVGRLGGGPARLEVAAGYACRTINNRPGGDISEHGKGRAIDISGVTLANGRTITVEGGWRRRDEGNILRRMHAAACGPFGTVLGPEADRYHQDHFHFDTKPRRRAYCR